MANPSLSPLITAAGIEPKPLDKVEPDPVKKTQRATPPSDADTAATQMTSEEKIIIASIAAGDSHQEMASRLAVSDATVELKLRNLCGKLSVANELELILYSLYHHLLDPLDAQKNTQSPARG